MSRSQMTRPFPRMWSHPPVYISTHRRRSLQTALGRQERVLPSFAMESSSRSIRRTVYAERFEKQPYEIQDAYGHSSFGRRLWNARQLVEYGASWVTVNLFESLNGCVTFDTHCAGSAPGTIQDYGRTLCPQFDRAMSGFLDDLEATGLWNDVLVICTGEMGRTPRINRTAGRDHWTRCWSGLVAGAGIPGGQVIGSTDARGAEIVDEPVAVQDLTTGAFRGVRFKARPFAGDCCCRASRQARTCLERRQSTIAIAVAAVSA